MLPLLLCTIIKRWLNHQLQLKPKPNKNRYIKKKQLLDLIDYAKVSYPELNITFPDFIACLHKETGDFIQENKIDYTFDLDFSDEEKASIGWK